MKGCYSLEERKELKKWQSLTQISHLSFFMGMYLIVTVLTK